MNMHMMQPLIGLTHVGKMLIMANAQDNTYETFEIRKNWGNKFLHTCNIHNHAIRQCHSLKLDSMDPLVNAEKAALCFNQLHLPAAIFQNPSVQQVARFGDGYLRSLLDNKFKFATVQIEPPNKRQFQSKQLL